MREIADRLGRAVSTISDELSRNRRKGRYIPEKAEEKAYQRRWQVQKIGKKIIRYKELRAFVEKHLHEGQSPEAVAGRLKREGKLPLVSKDAIYRYIKSVHGRLLEYIRSKRGLGRRRTKPRTKPWKDRVWIEKRPKRINTRRNVGDAEGDFIVSGRSGHGILFVVVDRKLRVTFIEQILRPSQRNVSRAAGRIKKRYPEWRSMTTDNDILFQHHKRLEKLLGVKIYFCHPGHAWEKGQVENTNRQIRRDIPKGSDISRFSRRFVQKVEERLNARMMKVLNYQTPAEILEKYRQRKKRRGA